MSAFGDTFVNNLTGQMPLEKGLIETGELPEGVDREEVKELFQIMEKGVDREIGRAEIVMGGTQGFEHKQAEAPLAPLPGAM